MGGMLAPAAAFDLHGPDPVGVVSLVAEEHRALAVL
jgi:hypothetical protein